MTAQRAWWGGGTAALAARWRIAAWPLGLVALVAGSCLLWLPYLGVPLDVDVAAYATAAYWWAHGDTLYRQIVIPLPQGILLVFRLVEAVGLGSVRGIHAVGMVCNALCALALVAIGGRLYGRGIGLGAAALFALVMGTPYLEGPIANAELFMLLPLLGSVYLLLRADDYSLGGRRALWLLAGCGLLAAVALLIKPSAVVGEAMAALWILRRWRTEDAPARAWLKAEAALGLGFALGLMPSILHGLLTAPGDYLNAVFLYRFTQDSAASAPLAEQVGRFVHASLVIVVRLPILLVAGVGLWPRRHVDAASSAPGQSNASLFVWLWLLTSLAGAAMGGSWWPHYYQQLLPPLAIAMALGLRRLYRCPRRYFSAGLQGLAVAGVLSFAVMMWPILTGSVDPTALMFGPWPPQATIDAIASYLRAHTAADERIYVTYQQPDIYYLAERRPAASRLDVPQLKWTPGAFDAQMARLADPATAPRYIVAVEPFDRYGFDDRALRGIVARDYTLETTIDGVPLYRRVR